MCFTDYQLSKYRREHAHTATSILLHTHTDTQTHLFLCWFVGVLIIIITFLFSIIFVLDRIRIRCDKCRRTPVAEKGKRCGEDKGEQSAVDTVSFKQNMVAVFWDVCLFLSLAVLESRCACAEPESLDGPLSPAK